MSVTCGNCSTRETTVAHESAQDVRECYFDGFTSPEARDAYREEEARDEARAEAAAERYFEEGTWAQREQYRWEVEQDERRAAFWAGAGVL